MLGVIEESQANTEIKGRYEAHGNFGCYAKAILNNKHRNNAPAATAIGHHRIRALNSGGKMKICKNHQVFKVIG